MTVPGATLSFDEFPVYTGNDLGVRYSPQATRVRIWAPSATALRMRLYEQGQGGEFSREVYLDKAEQGTWTTTLPGDQEGVFYTFQSKVKAQWSEEVTDPYATAVGINGLRGQIVDMAKTNPVGWSADRRPALQGFEDILIYELQLRDISTHPSSGIINRGKYLGLAETGTRSPEGLSTGLDHIKEMGVTHVHILPAFDFRSIDEAALEDNQYNWGYDPQHYNVPEGSFSTNPADGAVRIREFKEMVKTLHDNGLRVILDVVYNHTGATESSNFNQLVPGYYYRQNAEGGFANGSACGNETASERPMMRQFIVNSVQYWAEEFHIDGFRFDLMGLHDQETMRRVRDSLDAIDPSIFVYGEGWTAGDSPLPEPRRALKKYAHQLGGIAVFSDDIRDGLKGHVFTPEAKGFVGGNTDLRESVKFGIVAATFHPQVAYDAVNYSDTAYAENPLQTITYVSCHDNHTLWDKLSIANADADPEDRKKMHMQALALVLTSQGVPFLHAGSEMLRSKGGVENSFESSDAVNQIDWGTKYEHQDVVDFVKGLIQLRKRHPAFRMTQASQIRQHLTFLDTNTPEMLAYLISDNANGDAWENIVVAFNTDDEVHGVTIPEGSWRIIASEEGLRTGDKGGFEGKTVLLPAHGFILLASNALTSFD